MPNTYPNQRMIKIHRESAKRDFLGIMNENWQAAARDLRPHALLLYLYLASNADGFTLALSPAAVREAVGMARSTYADQFQILIDKGYLVLSHGNTYEFFETPQTRPVPTQNSTGDANPSDYPSPNTESTDTDTAKESPTEHIEINNSTNTQINSDINKSESFTVEVPKVKEITIQRPKVEGKLRPNPFPFPKEGEFSF